MVGVEATTPDGPLRVNAALTVAAGGRDSAVRDSLGLVPVDYGVPIDVLWFRVPGAAADETDAGHLGEYSGWFRARDDSPPRLLSVWASYPEGHFS